MLTGILAGITWALETVLLGIALGMSPLVSTEQAILLAPFIGTFFHDAFSALLMLGYNACRRNLKNVFSVLKSKSLPWLILASAIGGPIGMTGYVLAVNHLGASVGAVASAVYPAIGTALSCIFLKEKVKWYQWVFLGVTLLGVYGLSYSPAISVENFWLGLMGAFLCAFGWGIEAVILAKCFKDPHVKNTSALTVRQIISALIYGALILPALNGWEFTVSLFGEDATFLFPTIAAAALCATISYLFYYKAIASIGAAKAMALNITYTAWAIVFTVVLLGDLSVLSPLTIFCAAIVVVCGLFAATDIKLLFTKHKKN